MHIISVGVSLDHLDCPTLVVNGWYIGTGGWPMYRQLLRRGLGNAFWVDVFRGN